MKEDKVDLYVDAVFIISTSDEFRASSWAEIKRSLPVAMVSTLFGIPTERVTKDVLRLRKAIVTPDPAPFA